MQAIFVGFEVCLFSYVAYNEYMQALGTPPVVTILGHVDHGKTSLLDYIRKTDLQAKEAGGITQTIGAYQIMHEGKKITFVDTPGHEAFAKMRARGGKVADIIVLVVAADDGIMEQTKEAISHAKASGAAIIVAINKIDVAGAHPEKVRSQLIAYDLIAEINGGDVPTVETSAVTGQGVDELLNKIFEISLRLKRKTDPSAPLEAVVLESYLDEKRGPIAHIIVRNGTLRSRDFIATPTTAARVKAITNWAGVLLSEVLPSDPAEVLGFNDVPQIGEIIHSFVGIKEAQQFVTEHAREKTVGFLSTADRVRQTLLKGDTTQIPLVVKADTQGSLEAITDALSKLDKKPVALSVIHNGIGGITESDILLAMPVRGIVIGFNVPVDKNASRVAQKEKVIFRTYTVIYRLIEELTDVVHGEIERILPTKLGSARVLQLFELSDGSLVAGSRVEEGTIKKGNKVVILRDEKEIAESVISSLRIGKEQVSEVTKGKECGIILKETPLVLVGDTIRAFS